MRCLIIAAGKGSRLRQRGDSKPLVPILGVCLIEHVIRLALAAGADDFCVVTGYQGDRVGSFLNELSDRIATRITTIENAEWEKDNGLSVLKARDYLREPFLLLMADHLFDPSILHELMNHPVHDGEITLCVDGNTDNLLADMKDVTRVKMERGKIRDIGKSLVDFNGLDTGAFLSTPAVFDALERCAEESGDASLTDAVRVLAFQGRANAVDAGGRFWIDVDDPAACQRAETALFAKGSVRGSGIWDA